MATVSWAVHLLFLSGFGKKGPQLPSRAPGRLRLFFFLFFSIFPHSPTFFLIPSLFSFYLSFRFLVGLHCCCLHRSSSFITPSLLPPLLPFLCLPVETKDCAGKKRTKKTKMLYHFYRPRLDFRSLHYIARFVYLFLFACVRFCLPS